MDELQNDGIVTGRQDEESADLASQAPSRDEEAVPESAADDSSASSAIANLPAICNWKSAPLFSALGGWVSLMWRNLFYSILPLDLRYLPVAVVTVLYVILFYSSYFTEKPRVKSSKAISFLNYACAGIIFGYCFNKNLKESKSEGYPAKGMAPSVAVLIWIALAAGSFGYYNFTASGQLAKQYSYDAATDSYRPIDTGSTTVDSQAEPAPESSEPQQVTIPKTNTTITVPAGWSYDEQINEEQGVVGLNLHPPYSGKKAGMAIMVWDSSAFLTEEVLEQVGGEFTTRHLSEDSVLAQNSASLSSVDSETASLVEINGNDYWKAEAEGSRAKTGSHEICMSYFHHRGVQLYQYTLMSLSDSQQINESLQADLEAIVESATYE